MPIIKRFFLSFSLTFLFVFNCGILLAEIVQVPFEQLKLKECLLPEGHFLQAKLKHLFQDPDMFKSHHQIHQAGFEVINRMHRGLMVASHPSLENYLIKKFQDKVPQKKQLKNYIRRVSGARALKNFIKLNNLQHIVVPQKWLYPLPKQFTTKAEGRSYILIVERMDLCGGKEEIAKRYYDIDLDVLRELCIVVYYFRGLNSILENMAFTNQNQIAFIDTDRWALKRDEAYLYRVMPYMREDRQQYALKVFQELEAQDLRN